MTFDHVNRRVHLYLGLALLPWLLMYGVSSIPFAHSPFFDRIDAARNLPDWTTRLDRALDVAVPEDRDALRRFGASLLRDIGITNVSFGTYRQSPTQVNVYAYSFWSSTQLKYFIDQKRLVVEDRRFRWDHFLTGMHARGGFEDERPFVRSWSVVVDLVCLAIIVWVASGIYMWWRLPRQRRWGLVAIVVGTGSFLVFAASL